MANICNNMLYLITDSKENYEKLVKEIEENLWCHCGTDLEENKSCEIDFESKWTFPHEFFQKLTDEIGEDDSLFIRVLSYEFGCEYVGYNVFQNGEWTDRINQ